jgi:hypothetical protein
MQLTFNGRVYTERHPPVWPEGEEEKHRKHAEQLSSFAAVRSPILFSSNLKLNLDGQGLMHEMRGLIEAEQEADRAHIRAKDYAARPVEEPRTEIAPATSHLPAVASQHPVSSQHHPTADAPRQHEGGSQMPAGVSHGVQTSQVASATQHHSAGQDAAVSSHHQAPVAPVSHHAPHQTSAEGLQIKWTPAHVDFATQVTVIPSSHHARENPKSPGTDDVFDPELVNLPLLREDDKTPKAESLDPFADDFTTLAAKLPAEFKVHPEFPYPHGSALASVPEHVAVKARPAQTYVCDSVDSDSGSNPNYAQAARANRHRVQPTMEGVMQPEAGVNAQELEHRLAHLPSDSPPRKHRPEPSMVDSTVLQEDQFDPEKLVDRLARVDLNPHHRIRESIASMGSINEGSIEGDEFVASSTKTNYSGSSRALEELDGEDEEDEVDPDYAPTLSTVPGSSQWGGHQRKERAAREIKSALVRSSGALSAHIDSRKATLLCRWPGWFDRCFSL